jgi:NAD+ kinase
LRLGLVVHPKKKMAKKIGLETIKIAARFREEGEKLDLILSTSTKMTLNNPDLPSRDLQEMDTDAIMCLGGDGTLLRVLRESNIPVIGVNVGSLGFLMEVPPDKLDKAIKRLIDGKYTIENRARIKTVLNGEILPDSTNEVVLVTSTPSKIQSFELYIDMVLHQKIRADGIIISTPTGSTGYAMSAGGSILDPQLRALQIVPLAPFMINTRPVIIPDNYVVSVKLADKTKSANLILDGSHRLKIGRNDDILITRSKSDAKLIKFDTRFYQRYQEKIAENSNRD